MSIFEKLFVVEKTDVQPKVVAAESDAATEKVVSVVNSSENIVNSIYEQNELTDDGNSIFSVSKLMNTLPKEMTTQKMQQTIAGILAVTDKQIPDLIADGCKRINVLNAAREAVVQQRTEEIERANSDIERLKQAIEAAQKLIKKAEDIREATEREIADEVEVIEKLIKFSEGMVDQK